MENLQKKSADGHLNSKKGKNMGIVVTVAVAIFYPELKSNISLFFKAAVINTVTTIQFYGKVSSIECKSDTFIIIQFSV
jgi:hypothetical protein